MDDIEKLRQQAKDYRQNNNYREAKDCYQEIIDRTSPQIDKWDGWGYGYCLRKLGNNLKALEIAKKVYKIDPDFRYNNNILGWAIYDLKMKIDPEDVVDENEFLQSARYILKITEQEKYSAYTQTVFTVVRYLFKKNRNPEQINDLLDRLVKNNLPEDNLNKRFSSKLEKWYLAKSKALSKMERYEDCLAISEEGLNNITNFTNDNQFWLRYRKAWSKGEIGYQDESISELKELLKYKREWYIQYYIARLLFQQEKYSEAKSYALNAALNDGKYKVKVNLYKLMSKILYESETEIAREHLCLLLKIKEENEWSVSGETKYMINKYELKEIDLSAYNLYQKLKKYWEKEKYKEMPLKSGEVVNIIADGRAGFIREEGGEEYYFKAKNFSGNNRQLSSGLKVNFYLIPSYDRKKEEETMMAVNINQIEV